MVAGDEGSERVLQAGPGGAAGVAVAEEVVEPG
jgi:hypothetical protein